MIQTNFYGVFPVKIISRIFLFSFVGIFSANAQENTLGNNKYTPVVSSEAAVLGTYGQTPVSLFNGLNDVSIPVYEMKGKDITIPITLRYNSGGNKVNDPVGWVGLAWNLTAGGLITRRTHGVPDESIGGEITYPDNPDNPLSMGGMFMQKGYMIYRDNLSPSTWSDYSNVTVYGSNLVDRNPDEFMFSVNGISGSFYMDHNGNFKVKSKQSLSVKVSPEIYVNTGLPQARLPVSFARFTLTDENGTQYVFGGTQNAIEFAYGQRPGAGYMSYGDFHFVQNGIDYWDVNKYIPYQTFPTAWYLTEIKSANGEQALFDYEQSTYGITISGQEVKAISWMQPNDPVKCWSATYPTYLSSITLNEEQVFFNKSLSNYNNQTGTEYGSPPSGYKKLDNILVARNGQQFKLISFGYNSNTAERMKLTDLSFSDLALTEVERRYRFEYNSLLLPTSYLSKSVDHWGYYNGKTVPSVSVNYTQTELDNFNNAKVADSVYAKAEMLQAITYPTGGKTRFFYELNKYAQIARQYPFGMVSQTGEGGGLRIRKVVDYPVSGPAMEREFYYVSSGLADNPNVSSGILSGVPLYACTASSSKNFQDISFNDLGKTFGRDVTYTRVVEKNAAGYKVNTYSNHDNGYSDVPAIHYQYGPATAFTSRELERGDLLSEEDYNTSGTLVYKKENFYNDDPNRFNDHVRAIATGPIGGTVFPTLTNSAAILYYTFTPYLKKTIETNYGLESFTKTTEFTYNDTYKKIIKVFTTNSKGNQNSTYYRYPFDVISYVPNGSEPDPVTKPLSNMIFKNNIAEPCETVQTTFKDGNEWLVAAAGSTYKGFSFTTPSKSVVLPSSLLKMEVTKPILKTSYVPVSSALVNDSEVNSFDPAMKPELTFDKYDRFGNLLEMSKAGIGKTSYIWGYRQKYPVAEIKNAALNEVYFQNFEENIDDYESNLTRVTTRSHTGNYSGLITNSSGSENVSHSSQYMPINSGTARIFTYSGWVYSDGSGVRLCVFMDRAGETNYFSYVDLLNANQTGRWVYLTRNFLVPADVVRMKMRLDNTSAGNVWYDDLSIHPADAQLSSYTYNYAYGMVSQTDPKGLTTTYNYDLNGRLINVRDQNNNVVKSYSYHLKN